MAECFCGHPESVAYWLRLRKITLNADDRLIEQARLLAQSQHTTLNAMFREWLEQLTSRTGKGSSQDFDALMDRLKHVNAGSRFGRDEMNKR